MVKKKDTTISDDLLRDIAYMYYEQNLTQQEIADKLFFSRTNISRYLDEAKNRGIVEINIRYPYEDHVKTEQKLCKLFNLENAYVSSSSNQLASEEYLTVCHFCAKVLAEMIDEETVMSISRGRTTNTVVTYLRPKLTYPEMKLIQLEGIIEEENSASFEEFDLIHRLQEKYNCSSYCMAVPYLLESKKMKDMITKRTVYETIYNMSAEIDLLCLSATTLEQWHKRLSKAEFNELKQLNAVGNIMGYFYDENGRIVDCKAYSRMVMPNINIFKARQRMLVGADYFKVQALSAALRGGLANIIVTSERTAYKMIANEELLNK